MFPSINSGTRYVYDGSEFQAGIGGALVDPTRAFGWVDDILLVFDESGTLDERLLHGPQVDQVLASEDASGDVQWFLGDHLGTIRDVVEYDSGTDSTTVVNHLQYSSFGQITSQTSSANEPRYAFTGREWDADADLYYYRARWYDPTAGRFISEDPIGFAAGDVNVSMYVGNHSAGIADPSGHQPPTGTGEAVDDPLLQSEFFEVYSSIDQLLNPPTPPPVSAAELLEMSPSDLFEMQVESYLDPYISPLIETWENDPVGAITGAASEPALAIGAAGLAALGAAAIHEGIIEKIKFPSMEVAHVSGQVPFIDAEFNFTTEVSTTYFFGNDPWDTSTAAIAAEIAVGVTIQPNLLPIGLSPYEGAYPTFVIGVSQTTTQALSGGGPQSGPPKINVIWTY
ncbi:MAG: hypothetical protein Fues2KO_41700 [Fuerstiella sp.]